MNDNTISATQELKNNVLDIMNRLQGFLKKYPRAELTQPSNDFILSKELLQKGEFNLAVCGKVKNGKSSLINAFIGKPLLPVCTDVATSRVFKISNASTDSFYVVYANGDKKQITEAQLASYGSQSVIDNAGIVDADKTIAYIEVNTKLDFLPEGVSIIDTPGIGSTYPQHTAITKQYLKMADAVLFVANPTPLEKIELDFLKEVVTITPNIMFVTTKIDENGSESVENTLADNTEKINKSIGDKLYRKVKMLTMSSTILMDAASSNDKEVADFNLEISGYDAVKAEMLKTIYLTQGYYRAGVAYNALVKYYQVIHGSLQNRLDAARKSGEEYDRLRQEYEEAHELFVNQMGEEKRRDVLNEVEMILKTMDYGFNQIFSSHGDFVKGYESEIDSLTSETISGFGEGLGEKIVSELQGKWNDLTGTVYEKMMDAVNRYNEECQMSVPDDIRIMNPDNNADPSLPDVTFKDKMAAARTEMLTAGMISTAATTVAGAAWYFFPAVVAPALPVLAPVLVVLGVGALLWGAVSGRKIAIDKQLAKNKVALKNYLYETVSSCKKQLVETSLQNGKYQSLYQGFVVAVRQQAQKAVTDIYEKYKKEIDAMKKTLTESRQNPQLIPALEQMLTEWQANKQSLQNIKQKLETINVN